MFFTNMPWVKFYLVICMQIKCGIVGVLLAFFSIQSFGQDKDSLKYEWSPSVVGQCPVRGLEVAYYGNAGYRVKSESDLYGDGKGQIVYNRVFKTKLRFPIFLNHKVAIAGSFEYSDEEIHFEDIENNQYPLYQSLNDKNLKSIGGSLYLMTQLRRNKYFLFRFNGKLKGDYWKDHIGDVSKYTFLKMELASVIGWKVNPRKSWGLGLAYSYTFGDPLIFPIFSYNHTFADKWGVEAFLPARIKFKYMPDPLCILSAKAKLHGGSYSIHLDDPPLNDFKTLELRRADVNFSFELEKGITDWLWFSLDLGYRTNINFDVTNKNHPLSLSGSVLTNEDNVIDSYVSGGMFYNFSIFITPSKTLLKKIGLK